MDIDRLISPTVVEAILADRVCVAGLRGLWTEYPFVWTSCGWPEDVLLFGMTLPLIV